ncbi:MAG: hypothetical protein JO006_15050 [Paucibacter sp.]|nr:hypothetical protein [Roseateles sp.]
MNPLLLAHTHTTKNRAELEASSMCGCCECLEIFPTLEITAYTGLDMASFNNPDAAGASETGVCPRCGGEALIGDKSGFPLVPEFLNRMNQAWFQKTLIRKPAPKTP